MGSPSTSVEAHQIYDLFAFALSLIVRKDASGLMQPAVSYCDGVRAIRMRNGGNASCMSLWNEHFWMIFCELHDENYAHAQGAGPNKAGKASLWRGSSRSRAPKMAKLGKPWLPLYVLVG